MHGREGERRTHRRHMWSVPAVTPSSVAARDTAATSSEYFFKDGRKICVGDFALFKPAQDSPPFIGIIHKVILCKEESVSLCVNWLYRPADVKLGKGISLEAAPNEVFYSFHRDEIPAASLLHPCKVAFLGKDVELPSGISSFVCRRVYDIENRCLWWLTDKDYINERQDEVDQLLDKTQIEMYGAVQSGGRSPKPLKGPTGTPQLKPGPDSIQNNSSSFASHVKVKKRDRIEQSSDPVKRERLSKTDDADSGQIKTTHFLKSEIAKITDKGGLVDFEGVEKLVQLMQPDGAEKKIDLASRILLVDVIAVTDRFDCLRWFVQLRGLPVLDEWLQEVHKGKIGDGNSPRESDKSAEEFLLALLRALDKLPVNLHALQTCNVGKSVNHLRSHKNSEIQRKARSLVDTWKKRVEHEMNIIDAKPVSSHGGSWPSKSVLSEVSHVGNRRTSGSSEVGMKSSSFQSSSGKSPPIKLGSVEAVVKFTSPSSDSIKSVASVATAVGAGTKDGGGVSEIPLSTIKEEKSSSSSQSQTNSQSCSGDHAKVGGSCREDARSSTAGSMSVDNKISTNASRHRKLSRGLHGSAVSVQKETSSGKFNPLSRNLTAEKASPTRVTCERVPDVPFVDQGSSQRLIVRLPSSSHSPARSASGGSFEDPGAINKASSLEHAEKIDNCDQKIKGKGDVMQVSCASDANMVLCRAKDGIAESDEGIVSSIAPCDEHSRATGDGEQLREASKFTGSSGIAPNPGRSYEASFNSINALIESCVKLSEASTTTSGGDDIGMNLLASVAAGEMPRSDVSPVGSPVRNSPIPEESCSGNDVKLRHLDENISQNDQLNDGTHSAAAMAEHISSFDSTRVKNESCNHAMPLLTNFSGAGKLVSFGCEEKIGDCSAQLNVSSTNLQHNAYCSCLTSDGNPSEFIHDAPVAMSSIDVMKGGNTDGKGDDCVIAESKSGAVQVRSNGVSNSKFKPRTPLFDDKKINYSDERTAENSIVMVAEAVLTSAEDEKEDKEESPSSSSSSEICREQKNTVKQGLDCGVLTEQSVALPTAIPFDSIARKVEDTALPSGSGNVLGIDSKAENSVNMKVQGHSEQHGRPKIDLISSILDHNSEPAEEKERKEVLSHCPGGSAPSEDSPTIPVQETEQWVKSRGCPSDKVEEDETEEPSISVNTSSPATAFSPALKLDIDLNVDFSVDDGSHSEPVKSPNPGNSSTVHLPCPLSYPISSVSQNFPASITVAAAAKGPFFPPENPLRSKAEVGWKGSAATSAFRPAEPRRVVPDMPLGTTVASSVDSTSTNKERPFEIDLNVPDQRVLEDIASQNFVQATCSESDHLDRSCGGLDLDLNKVDESPETGQLSVNIDGKLDVPQLHSRSSLSNGFSNGKLNASRDFDLNNGPGPDETGIEAASNAKSNVPFLSPVSGARMNTMELGNFSSWFPQGNSYSPIAFPSIIPGRGEQNYPVVPATGSQRIIGPPTGVSYRGPVLSSSPAVAFPPVTPFQYPGFPLETNFPLSTNSFSGCSTAYVDTSSGSPLCFPAIPSQVVGPTSVVSPHYPRPYVMSLPGGMSNLGLESRKFGGQALDLNAGPGGADLEWRDEKLPSVLRQLPLSGSQALADEQLKIYQIAGGVLKRKGPDVGWDGDRNRYKQPPWQ